VTPGKSGGGGAYPSGGAAGRREESSGTAAFADREGAPVFVVGCDEVLQLRRDKGVRKLRGLETREGAHRGVADGGGARLESERGRGFRCDAREGDRRGLGDGGADGISGAV
jgi:hypothetical protein